MTAIKITAKNFRSFRNVSYTIQPSGLVAVEGMYEGTKDRSNGAGKSTLIPELLCWAIYGETVDGKKGVCSTYSGADQVEVAVELPFVSWVRTQKADGTGNKIHIEGIRDLADAKAALLKFFPPKKVFASTMILGQGVGERFSSWTPGVRAQSLSELLNLMVWPDARKKLSTDRTGYKNQLQQTQGAISMLASQLHQLTSAPRGDPGKRQKAAAAVAKITGELQRVQTDYSTANQDLAGCAQGIGSYESQAMQLGANADQLRSYIAGGAQGLNCPTCKRAYPKSQVAKMLAENKQALLSTESELKAMNKAATDLKAAKKKAEKLVVSAQTKLAKLNPQHTAALQELNATQSHAEQIEKLQAQHKTKLAEADDLTAYIEKLDLLDRAFFEIPIRKIDGVLGILNARLVEVCNSVWESEFLVQLVSEHSLKKGGSKAEIGMYVENKAGDYKGSSPGQRRKIDITVQLAIRDLLMSSWPNALPLLVCDDVVDVLDPWAKRTFYKNYLESAALRSAVFVLTPQGEYPVPIEHKVLVGYTEEEGSSIVSSSAAPVLEFHGQQ